MNKLIRCVLVVFSLYIAVAKQNAEGASMVKPNTVGANVAKKDSTLSGIKLDPAQQGIVNDMSWPVKIMFYKRYLSNKAGNNGPGSPGSQAGLKTSAQSPLFRASSSEERQMKLNLFSLMDETARECELKVKRADLIKAHYKNNSAFGVGTLMGSINDKYRHMTDTASTLKKMYHEWKPIEHINAYEQIANEAIELGRLVETARYEIQKLDAADPEYQATSTTLPPEQSEPGARRIHPRIF